MPQGAFLSQLTIFSRILAEKVPTIQSTSVNKTCPVIHYILV